MGVKEDLIGTNLNDLETLENIETELTRNGARKSRASLNAAKLRAVINSKPSINIDEILKKSGGFGRYQLFLILCIGMGGALYVSVQNLSITFVETSAAWHCITPKCNITVGPGIHYDLNTLCNSNLSSGDWSWINANHTALSDFGQACGSHTVLTNVLYFCPGVIVGGIIFGMMGWSTGRKTPFLSALLTSMVASVISAASREYILFMVLRVLLGASIAGYELLHFCWVVELVSKKWRPLAVGVQGVFCAAGLLIVLYVNETWDYWRYKMVYVGIVSLVFIFVYAAVPESPFWLLAKGQDDVAVMVLKKICILNGHQYPDSSIAIPIIKVREKAICFFQPRYKRIGAFIMFNWVLVGMVYYYIFLSLDSYGTPNEAMPVTELKKMNYMIVVGVEVPAVLIGTSLLCSLVGRKFAYIINIGFFAVCTAVSLLDYTVYEGWDVRRGAVLIGAKFGITAAKLVLALWTAEIAPTTIRTLFFGMCLGAGSIGVVVTSALIYIAASPLCCVIVMTSMAVLSIIGSTQISDTSKWDLPDNLLQVYRLVNENTHATYSDLQSELPTGTTL